MSCPTWNLSNPNGFRQELRYLESHGTSPNLPRAGSRAGSRWSVSFLEKQKILLTVGKNCWICVPWSFSSSSKNRSSRTSSHLVIKAMTAFSFWELPRVSESRSSKGLLGGWRDLFWLRCSWMILRLPWNSWTKLDFSHFGAASTTSVNWMKAASKTEEGSLALLNARSRTASLLKVNFRALTRSHHPGKSRFSRWILFPAGSLSLRSSFPFLLSRR